MYCVSKLKFLPPLTGVYSDLLQLLLQALFTLQEGEDDEVKEDATQDVGESYLSLSFSSLVSVLLYALLDFIAQHFIRHLMLSPPPQALTLRRATSAWRRRCE